jgi:hypothetical protein
MRRLPVLAALTLVLAATLSTAGASDTLVLLQETGEKREGLPVLKPYAGGEEIAALLSQGLSGTLLRVYREVQTYLERAEGIQPEPAYVLLGDRSGGYARHGFFLGDVDKRHAYYVDLSRDAPVVGEFGAIDQLFPHELFHALRSQLVGPLGDGYANQVHALGVRTDRITAFNEGVAEHFQAMAIDDPGAHPSTRALGRDLERATAVTSRLERYGRELAARLAIVPRLRMGFLAWFSNDEDVLRYVAVKSNSFARQRQVPESLLAAHEFYRAYLFESTLPGRPQDPAKSLSRLLATEGVVSALLQRWGSSERLRQSYREPAFYALFGVQPEDVPPAENVYLKIAHVLHQQRVQDVAGLVGGYAATFPDEADTVADLVTEVFFVRSLDPPPELWLAHSELETGTTLFDQYRGLPREHTFDLNGASEVDLVAVPGVTIELARRILGAAPFDSLEELSAVEGMDAETLGRFRGMASRMQEIIDEAKEESVEEILSLRKILLPYAWRAGSTLLAAALLGAALYRTVRRLGSRLAPRPSPPLRDSRGASAPTPPVWWRAGLAGLAATLAALLAGWAAPQAGLASLATVAVLLALPAALRSGWRARDVRAGGWTLLAWLAAALPAAVAVTPLF